MTRLTKAEILSRFVDGAKFGPTEMASSNDMFDSLVFCTGENEMVGKQRFGGGQEWVNLAAVPSKPPAGYMVIYYRNGDIFVIDDSGAIRKLAWDTTYTSMVTILRSWAMSKAYYTTDDDEVLWPDGKSGTIKMKSDYDELTYPGYIVNVPHDRKSLPEVINV